MEKHADKSLELLGFEALDTDQCVFSNADHSITVSVYVDDGLIMAKTQEECDNLLNHLSKQFKLKRLDASCFLKLELNQDAAGVRVSQKSYILELLTR